MNMAEFTTWEEFEELKRQCARGEHLGCYFGEVVLVGEGVFQLVDQPMPYGALFGELPLSEN